MNWSPQQNEALAKAGAWLRMRYSPVFYLSGYAGTGKTTLAIHLAKHADGPVAFAAFTGKAAMVMRSKGCKGARTIHSLIYAADTDPVTGVVTMTLKPPGTLDKYSLIIIDECSMVNEEMGIDLLSFGRPILVLGDPAQLPPVSGGGYFTSRKPDYVLTEVHRQAAESPIIRLATAIRERNWDRQLVDVDGLVVTTKDKLQPWLVTSADMVLVGRNATRQKYNARLRELAGKTEEFPVKGEPVICLRNDKELKIFNGEILTVQKSKSFKKAISLWVGDEERGKDPIRCSVRKEFFSDDVAAAKLPFKELRGTQQFTFGYAITCHKSQGSQWPSVCIFDESAAFRDSATRWLYTAVTRASDQLTLVI